MTIPAFIIAVFCAIGIMVSMNFIMDAIFKAMDSSRNVKRSVRNPWIKSVKKLDEISKNLNK